MSKHRHRFAWLGWLNNAEYPENDLREAAWCRCGALMTNTYTGPRHETKTTVIKEAK